MCCGPKNSTPFSPQEPAQIWSQCVTEQMIVATSLTNAKMLVLRSCQCALLKMTAIGATREGTSIGKCKFRGKSNIFHFNLFLGFKDRLQPRTLGLTLTTAQDLHLATIFILRPTRDRQRWVSSVVLTFSLRLEVAQCGSTITSLVTMLAPSQFSQEALSMERSHGKR